jgi:ssRNA-specific RNase YbeY (16S rRNA maturation enzyme)
VLHILGFDHEIDEEYEAMKKWEELVWGEVFN